MCTVGPILIWPLVVEKKKKRENKDEDDERDGEIYIYIYLNYQVPGKHSLYRGRVSRCI